MSGPRPAPPLAAPPLPRRAPALAALLLVGPWLVGGLTGPALASPAPARPALAGPPPAQAPAAPALDPAAGDRFFPAEGAETVSLAELERAGLVAGRSGRVLVGGGDAAAIAAVSGVAAVVRAPAGYWRVTPAVGVDDLAPSRALHSLPGVDWAHPDLLLRLRPTTDDPLQPAQWHLDNTGQGGRIPGVDIDAPAAWAFATGAGQTIAVLDSGVQLDHPDLRVTSGHDYISRDEDASPDTDSSAPHGTCVAGVAAGVGGNGIGVSGVAPDAEVYAIRLIGGNTSLDDLANAFAEATDAGASVLSNSWGFEDDCGSYIRFGSFTAMFNYVDEHGRGGLGSVIVFAAGNGNCDIGQNGMLEHEKVITVAALEWNDVRAGYSNYGEFVDISAPTSLLTTDIVGGGYGSYGGDDAYVDGFGGTSAATPVVSGVVALMLEANPRLTPKQVREVLCDTATRVDVANAGYDGEGWSPWYGCGRIDAAAAVAAVASAPPEAPVPALPRGEAREGEVTLTWAPAADPDGDVVAYEVSWGTDSLGDPTLVSGLSLTLPAQAAGVTVSWQVRALDPWGPGPWSELASFTVVPSAAEAPAADTASDSAAGSADTAPSSAPTGCATAPASSAPRAPSALLLLAAPLLLRVRRRAALSPRPGPRPPPAPAS